MVQSQHFCTERNVKELKDPDIKNITTYRTGWIPQYQIGQIINLKIRNGDRNDKVWCQGIVREISLILYRDIPTEFLDEIIIYKRGFNHKHRFFKEVFEKLPTGYYYNEHCPKCSKQIFLRSSDLNNIPASRVYKNDSQEPPVMIFCSKKCKTIYLRGV